MNHGRTQRERQQNCGYRQVCAAPQAQAQVQAAKRDIESDRAAAEKGLQADAVALAQEIVRRVLQPAGAGR